MARTSSRTSALAARLLCSTAILLLPSVALANPAGGQVKAGSASIAQPNAATTTVTQQSEKAVIDWRSFSIGLGEATTFQQPDAKAITLNRVTGVDPSKIAGSLTANGQVWLINPNGIAFSKSARVDVAGLLATTIDISNKDFMAGNYHFQSARDPSAMVTNAGHITIHDTGLAALVAPGVANSGVIEANLGQIQLSSAAAFTVDLYGDGLFNITLDKQVTKAVKKADGTTAKTAVSNSGTLIANGGKILMTADAAKSVVDHAIDMTGYAQATSASVAQNGDIVLDGGSEGTVVVAGTLDASGKAKGQIGGTVEVTGHNVQLASTAKVDASGDTDGGTVHIGGDEHGAGPLRNASATSVASGATINANSVTSGNGGNVVVWSDNQTDFQGRISAKGGSASGDGGSTEVSSHGVLTYIGTTNLQAPNGAWGTLLLDPENVTIAASGDTPTLPSSPSGPIDLTPNADDSKLAVSTLQSALGLADVVVSTGAAGSQTGDITVASSISWNSSHSLSLSAARNIVVGANITNSSGASISLESGLSGSGVGTVLFDNGAKVSTSGFVTVFFNPTNNPAGSGVNSSSYTAPNNTFATDMTGGAKLTTFMLVDTVYDLQNVENNLSANYVLGANIDGAVTATWNSGAGFLPLGNSTTPFSANFLGLGHTISNLTIKDASDQNIGLFGVIGSTGYISSLTLKSPSVAQVSPPSPGSWNRGVLAGTNLGTITYVNVDGADTSVVGENSGTITNAAVTGTASDLSLNNIAMGALAGSNSGTISSSSATGSLTVSGNNDETGGLVGSNTGSIALSYADVTVTADGTVGGLTGYNTGTISKSYASGAVVSHAGAIVGGLVGRSENGSITQSYAKGSVTGGAASEVGGLVGLNDGSIDTSYAAGNVTGGDASTTSYTEVGGLVGINGTGSITKSYATGSAQGGDSVFICNTCGAYDAQVGGLVGANDSGTISYAFATGSVTAGQDGDAGGLVGNIGFVSSGSLTNSFATGDVTTGATHFTGAWAGGLVGSDSQPISLSYATGTVRGGDGSGVGGFAGVIEGTNAKVTQSYALSSVGLASGASSATLGAFVGKFFSGTISVAYFDTDNAVGLFAVGNDHANTDAVGRTSSALKSALLSGFDSTEWTLTGGENNGFPSFPWQNQASSWIGTWTAGANSLPSSNFSTVYFGGGAAPVALTWSVSDTTSTYGTLATLGAATLSGVTSADQGDVFGTVDLYSDPSMTSPVTLSSGLNAGTYYEGVTGLTGSAAGNYTLASSGNILGKLTIDPKTLTWTVQNVSSTYGTTPTVGSATLFGILNGDDVGWDIGVFNGSSQVSPTYFLSAGMYTEKVTGLYGPDASNYVLATNGTPSGTLTISPKPLAWSVANATSTYGSTPTLGTVQLFGVVSVDDVHGVPGLVGVTNPSATTPVGTYSEDVIGLAGAKAGNYVLSSTGNAYGTLTIEEPAGYSSFVAQTSTPAQIVSTASPTNQISHPLPIAAAEPLAMLQFSSASQHQTIPIFPATPISSFSSDGSLVNGLPVYVTIGNSRVPVFPQREDLRPNDKYSLDCVATVFAMIGSIESSLHESKQVTVFARTYTNSLKGYDATMLPPGAPAISLQGISHITQDGTIRANVTPVGLPNIAFLQRPVTGYTNSTGIAVIAGTFPGATNKKVTYQHVMLAIGTQTINGISYVSALDPETGLNVAIRSSPSQGAAAGTVAGQIIQNKDGTAHLNSLSGVPGGGQVSNFSAWGFATVSVSGST